MKIKCFDIEGNPIELSKKVKQAYVEHIQKKNPNTEIEWIEVTIDGEYVDLKYKVKPKEFQRIRRITGYLVGSLDTWNDYKRAEERDRVKHI